VFHETGSSLDTDSDEMEQFLGIHIMTGIVKKQILQDKEFFHISYNSNIKAHGDPDYDKLLKLRPFVDSIKASFLEMETEKYNSVDE
jgi:hypothetical protein